MMTQTVADAKKPRPAKAKMNSYPFWCVRFWHGMRLGDWTKLVVRNRFRFHPIRVPMAVLVTPAACFNTFMGWLQSAIYGKRIAETKIEQPPLFIIGHWRSGTTLLHELLVLDERFTFPTTFQCFAPHHFLLTEWFFTTFCGWLLPKQRPMDNMATGFTRPQEDEFALLTMGAPTPYVRMAFPNHEPPYDEFLDMQGVDEADRRRFCDAMRQFVQRLTFHANKRVVLKSPPHTGRIETLAELFPGAQFIHITRDPRSLFPSTKRLWQSLDGVQGFQIPRRDQNLDEYVLHCLERMYTGFEAQRQAIDPANICDVRYEDLVAEPLHVVEQVYDKLNLGDFANVREKLEQYFSDQQDYQPNVHQLAPEIEEQIRTRWAGYIERYGYG